MNNKVLAINDLSGFGNTSLMALIPLLYKYGLEVCALPSSLLSSNTCFPGYQLLATDVFMKDCLKHWQELGMEFGAIYSGFLGNPQQVDTVLEPIETLAITETLVLIDPVMADNGELYPCYDEHMILAMRRLIAKADIITPNFTEACFLAGIDPRDDAGEECFNTICNKLHDLGACELIITGAPGVKDGCNIIYSASPNTQLQSYACQYIPCFFTGTGDIFSTLMLVYMLKGIPRPEAITKAADFIYNAINHSLAKGRDGRAGVLLQDILQTGEYGCQ